jgi:phosphomannomutase
MTTDNLRAAAEAWLAQDPDPETRAELQAVLDSGDEAALADRMGSRIGFGTAGLRGLVGAGSNRMNRVLVGQAAAGIGKYLLAKAAPGETPSVVIGFDARKNSRIFAQDSAEILAGMGITVVIYDRYVATPMISFAVKCQNLSAGIMVTASHNPRGDNGYKVYLGGANGGSQIVEPVDAEIAAEIATVAESTTFDELPKSSQYSTVPEAAIDYYFELAERLTHPMAVRTELKVVYTPLHGVGWAWMQRMLAENGFADPILVTEQIDPNPDFPTTPFPNPEEDGALDLALETARANSADLVVANDPDADRVAIAVRDDASPGGYYRLSGDEIGLLLGWQLATNRALTSQGGVLAESIASSGALAEVARLTNLGHVETLTGFKWIARVPNLVFGYEEALGYSVDPQHVPDKDGLTAALVLIELAENLAATDRTLLDQLATIQQAIGYFLTSQVSVRLESIAAVKARMAEIVAAPPREIAGLAATVRSIHEAYPELPFTPGLRIDLAGDRRILIRPSGTEAKLKCYLRVIGESRAEAESQLAELTAAVRDLLG